MINALIEETVFSKAGGQLDQYEHARCHSESLCNGGGREKLVSLFGGLKLFTLKVSFDLFSMGFILYWL